MDGKGVEQKILPHKFFKLGPWLNYNIWNEELFWYYQSKSSIVLAAYVRLPLSSNLRQNVISDFEKIMTYSQLQNIKQQQRHNYGTTQKQPNLTDNNINNNQKTI